MPKQKQPSMPFLIEVEFYPEFRLIQGHLNLLNKRIKVARIDKFYDSSIYAELGVVYEGRRPSKAKIKKLIEAKEIHSFYNF